MYSMMTTYKPIILKEIKIINFVLFWGHTCWYMWSHLQESLYVGSMWDAYGILGIKTGLTTCRKRALPTVLSLRPKIIHFKSYYLKDNFSSFYSMLSFLYSRLEPIVVITSQFI